MRLMYPWQQDALDARWDKREENAALRVAKKHNLQIDRKAIRAMINAVDNWRHRQTYDPSIGKQFAEDMALARKRSMEELLAQESYDSAPVELPGFRQPPAEQEEYPRGAPREGDVA